MSDAEPVTRTLEVAGLPADAVADALARAGAGGGGEVHLVCAPMPGGSRVVLRGPAAAVAHAADRVRLSLPDAVVAADGGIAAAVLAVMRERGLTLAVAESLTGGLLAAALVAVPGASDVFRGSVTAYATDVKASVLGVAPGLLARRGAVDPQVAEQMAAGARGLLGADVGIATTGVAGPDPQDGRPPGTVFVAVDGPRVGASGGATAIGLRLAGDRQEVRLAAVTRALDLACRALLGLPSVPPS